MVKAAVGERARWFPAPSGPFELESTDARFGDLLRYWLAGKNGDIRPGKLEALQTAAIAATLVYGNLQNATLRAAINVFAAREQAVNTAVTAVYTRADAVDSARLDVAPAKAALVAAKARVAAAAAALGAAKAAKPPVTATISAAEAALTKAKVDRRTAAAELDRAVGALTAAEAAEKAARARVTTAKAARKAVTGPAQAWPVSERNQARLDVITSAAHTDPQKVETLVDEALQLAHQSRADIEAWSAAFVGACVRAAALALKLEAVNSAGAHVGKNGLLLVSRRHSDYVQAARDRRIKATYRAFDPPGRKVELGDIIVTDRADFITAPVTLKALTSGAFHGDIVTELEQDALGTRFAETIGGNVGHSVRRRRYPLDASGQLIVAKAGLFSQENAAGQFSAFVTLPKVPRLLQPASTGRVMALLSLVETCAPPPVATTPRKGKPQGPERRKPELELDSPGAYESPFLDEEVFLASRVRAPDLGAAELLDSPFTSDLAFTPAQRR